MKNVGKRAGALLGAVLCVCACLVGCERGEALPSSSSPAQTSQPAATSAVPRAEVRSTTASIEERANDPVYQKQLTGDFGQALQRIGQRRAEIERQMARLREHAKKKGLPRNATDEQVEAALESGPRRAWRELIAERNACFAEEARLRAAAQATVAQRISRKEQSVERAQGAVPEAK